jgi:hypothetical protein
MSVYFSSDRNVFGSENQMGRTAIMWINFEDEERESAIEALDGPPHSAFAFIFFEDERRCASRLSLGGGWRDGWATDQERANASEETNVSHEDLLVTRKTRLGSEWRKLLHVRMDSQGTSFCPLGIQNEALPTVNSSTTPA